MIDPKSKAMDLTDKVAIVTGAASGIGRAIALRFCALGAKVVVADVNEAGAEETVKAAADLGGTASFVRCDVTKYEQVRQAVATTRERYGKLDIAVNNAGWDIVQPFIKTEPDFWDKVIDINLKGQIYLARAAFDAFIEQESGGRIVNLASEAGRNGSSGETVYSACKGGVIALTKALAREGLRYNIIVNGVAPGITDTPFVAALDQKVIEAIVKVIPMRRMADPDEPAEMVAFLASESNTYMTGQVVSVGGGLSMI